MEVYYGRRKNRKTRKIMSIEELLKKQYEMEIVPNPDEGCYIVRFPELPGCFVIGDTTEKVKDNAEDAKRAWF